ncbi:MAG: efflux RND transporter permease subunit, partial [Acidobacteriota bacterium]|nr:efflux RND transporter permease subunit [Acidobacteriota bacterium]
TFSMFFAALLSVTLVPLLMIWFIRGKIPDERRNPINRFLIWAYHPLVKFVLRFRRLALIIAAIILLFSWFPYSRIGSEFMPPLNEGSLLYMPTAPPGVAISEAKKILQRQDAIIAKFPEVQTVFGKVGRSRSATDPAPLSMIETVITLKPQSQWRAGMTFEKIKEQLTKELPFPGMPAIWWMPIQTRIEMMATGIRSQIGIKVLGKDLPTIEKIAVQIEALLKKAPHTASAFAERVTGGYYVDFKVNRDAIARYGLTVADVENVIESAIGGKNIETTIEGRERFPINVRYARDFRSDLPALKRVLVSTPSGAQIPLEQLAEISKTTGPPSIRDENGSLAGFVFVDTYGIDLGSYVENAKKLIAQNIKLPPGYFIEWGGQYQYLLKAKEKLKLIVPLTLLLIFVLLYLNFGNVAETFIVILSIPFALVGGVWLIYWLGYNYSVAVAVGFIALAGVATETGVVMIVYLDEAWRHLKQNKPKPTAGDLYHAVMEGAVQRVRPKMMTVSAIMGGLLPIMWGHGAGADTMKRIAAPMVGGMLSSTILTLLIIPAIYFSWRSREVEREAVIASTRRKRILVATTVAVILAAGAWWLWPTQRGGGGNLSAVIQTQAVGDYQFEILGKKPEFHVGQNPVEIRVTRGGAPVDVGTISLELRMDMPGMPMRANAPLAKTAQPGVYSGSMKIDTQGEYTGQAGYSGPKGAAQKTFTVHVAQ